MWKWLNEPLQTSTVVICLTIGGMGGAIIHALHTEADRIVTALKPTHNVQWVSEANGRQFIFVNHEWMPVPQ